MLILFNYKIVIVIFCIQTFETVRAVQMKSNGKPHVFPFYVYTIMDHICSHITFCSVVVILHKFNPNFQIYHSISSKEISLSQCDWCRRFQLLFCNNVIFTEYAYNTAYRCFNRLLLLCFFTIYIRQCCVTTLCTSLSIYATW